MATSGPYALAYQVDRLMRRMNAGLEGRAAEFDPDRIGPIGGMILLTIADLQPVPMQQIAEAMARDKAQLSRAIGSLERRGFVTRAAHESDRRSSMLSLSEDGTRFVETIKASLNDVLEEVLNPLTQEERDQLLEMLTKL